ncbi:zinc finger protein 783-like [Bombina bombina]|uniref:zinc finger protein 783-like n=1 Tax=Bombina bombina TaxID=8345 RepID=UPI00235A603B|nr:zinc finger protein 783-like [Bombina bombina]
MEQMEFDEVAVYFSEEEWGCLTEEQKELYKDVMMENYQTLRSLGYVPEKPLLVTKIEHREEPYVGTFAIVKGDSGYSCLPWLFTPVNNPTVEELRYNEAHNSQPFGILKSRF